MGKIYKDYLNKSQTFWNGKSINYPSHSHGYEVAVFNSTTKIQQESPEGLVVLGFNPSGAKLGTLASTLISGTLGTSSAFYEYDPFVNIDPYTKAVQRFAIDCGYSNNYYKLDAFGIIEKTQDILEKKINNNPSHYDPVFELPISAIVQLKPKVVVFANAGLRRLIIVKQLFKKFITNCKWNTNKCAYDITLTDCNGNTHTCYGVFTTMLSGHPIDNGSREIIVQVIKNL